MNFALQFSTIVEIRMQFSDKVPTELTDVFVLEHDQLEAFVSHLKDM